MLKVKEIMTKNVLTAKTNTPFNEVVKVLTSSKINHLPIINTNWALRAIISSTDVLKAMHEMDQFAIHYNGFSIENRIDVRDEMSSDVISISAETDLKEAVRLMVDNDINALPIMEDDEIFGIITSKDILKAIYLGKLNL